MSDEIHVPDEHITQQQTEVVKDPTLNWEARYKGSVRKIEELTLKNREIEKQLFELNTKTEQFSTDLSQKEVEKDVIRKDWEDRYKKTYEEFTKANSELTDLRKTRAKIDAIRETGYGNLYPIIDHLPYSEDPETLKGLLKEFADWGDKLVESREKQLTAGVTPPTTNTVVKTQLPDSAEEWSRHINSLSPGSEDKSKAMEQFWQWGITQQK